MKQKRTGDPDPTPNDRLRQLVEASGLTQIEALARFNRGLGPRGYSLSTWKAFFVRKDSGRHRPFRQELLERAEKIFARPD